MAERPTKDSLVWSTPEGEWTLHRTLYRIRCDWELVNPSGKVVGDGMATAGNTPAAVRSNATRAGRRLLHKLTQAHTTGR